MFIKILEQIGLNDREIKVYLATLELGESTVLPISKKSGIKRTYCYDILDDLKKKNLVSYYEKNGRRRYLAEDPQIIEDLLKNRLREFDSILPDLRAIYNKSVEKPKMRYFEGKEGIISIYNEILKTRPKTLDAIGSLDKIENYLGDYFKEYLKKIAANKTQSRDLVTENSYAFSKSTLLKSDLQQVRILPASNPISTDMMIFDNKLVMISYGDDVHAVVIESSAIVASQKAMFEIIWNVSNTL
jgi:sugar-specific transcriptional regulator TrmB